MAGFEYGTMDTGVTGGPNVKKPMDINEFMVRQTPPIPSGMVSSELTGEIPGGGNFASPTIAPPSAPTGTDWGGVMKNLAPILAQLGAATSANAQNPIMAGVGGVVSSALQGQQMNERLKKMVNEAVAGKEGFPGSPVSEISAGSGLETLGLNPEQITGLYKTGMELREKERAFPLALTTAYSNASHAFAAGDLARVQAEAKNIENQIAVMPATIQATHLTKLVGIYKDIAEMQSKVATTRKTEEEISGIKPQAEATLAKTKAETEAIPTETTLKQAEADYKEWQRNPARHIEEMQRARAMPHEIHDLPEGGYGVLNKVTGIVTKYGSGGGAGVVKTTPAIVNSLSLMQTSSTMLSMVEKDFIANLPPGTKDARAEWGNFLAALKNESDPAAKDVLIRGQLSGENQQKYNRVLDLYRSGISQGMPTASLDKMVRDTILTETTTPTVTPPPGKKTPPLAPTTKGTMLAPKNIIDAFTAQKKPAGIYPVTINGVTTRYQWDGKGKAYAIK